MNYSEFIKQTMPIDKTYPERHWFFRSWVIYGMQYPASLFSYFLSFFGVTANQISVLRVVISLSVLPLFLFSNTHLVVGVLVYYFALISDCIDGQLARIQKTGTLEGIFVDSVTSAVMFPCMHIALGLASYNWSGNNLGIILVALILGIKGLAGESKNTTIMKLMFSEHTTLKVKETDLAKEGLRKVPTKIRTPESSIKVIVKLLLFDNHFFVVRMGVVLLIGILFESNPIFIYVYLGLDFLMVSYREARTSRRIYSNGEITRFIQRYYPLLRKTEQ